MKKKSTKNRKPNRRSNRKTGAKKHQAVRSDYPHTFTDDDSASMLEDWLGLPVVTLNNQEEEPK